MADAASVGRSSEFVAFISYSHANEDLGDWLHKRLESYDVPRALVGRQGPSGPIGKRLGKVFRDRPELRAGADLSSQINTGLQNSHALIVLCSPQSSSSTYVNDEIRYFKSLETTRSDRVFAAIIDGKPHASERQGVDPAAECFPKALFFTKGADGAEVREVREPIAADFREKKDGRENGALKLIAGLLGVPLDELIEREKQAERARRFRANAIAAVMGVLALAAIGGGAYAYQQQGVAQRAQRTAEQNEQEARAQLRSNVVLQGRMDSVVAEMTDIVENNDNVPDKLAFFVYAAPQGLSAAALGHLFRLEFDSSERYEAELSHPHDDAGYTTIGIAYQLRYATPEELRRDWEGTLDAATIERLVSFTGERARGATDGLRDIHIPWRDALRVFGQRQLPVIVARTRRAFPNTEGLPSECLTALMSTVVNKGSNVTSGPLKTIHDLMEARRYAEVPDAIRSFSRYYTARGMPPHIVQALGRRTEADAQLFEQGLQIQARLEEQATRRLQELNQQPNN